MFINWWLDQQKLYSDAMGCYSVMKRNGVLTQARTWRKLENIVLSEESQSQGSTYCYETFRKGKSIETQDISDWLGLGEADGMMGA